MELHKMYLERLQGVKNETLLQLAPIAGIGDRPLLPLLDAVSPLSQSHPWLVDLVREKVLKSATVLLQTQQQASSSSVSHNSVLTKDEAAALYLYTEQSAFYKQLNQALRNAERAAVTPYYCYLRLFFHALDKLPKCSATLYRGVNLPTLGQLYHKVTLSVCVTLLTLRRGILSRGGASHLARQLLVWRKDF